MDKYEYNLKLEEIDKLVDQEDYKEAANLADTIDWRRVRNIRTLCLISEIYEAAGRLKESKDMLVRAYRKVPVGRTVLYRLVEVTTALRQYDEALEYYTEYVQAAPHDNNRFILKYMIYRGRGSQPEELIEILKEYLDQEYTERWAYELATLYQQAGQMQNCLAVCDDLVLWFHTGKYVKKALELKRRYAVLTPRQQQIYEECLQEEAQEEYFDEPEEEEHIAPGADGEVLAESIMSETEKKIADEITARKAEIDKAAADTPAPASVQSDGQPGVSSDAAEAKSGRTRMLPRLHFGRKEKKEDRVPEENAAESAAKMSSMPVQDSPSPKTDGQDAAGQQEPAEAELTAVQPETSGTEQEPEAAEKNQTSGQQEVPESGQPEAQDAYLRDSRLFQEELARSVRQIVSGVARRPELNEEDVPAVVGDRLQHVQKLSIPEVKEPEAGKLSIDDILLSMSEKGKRIAEEARRSAAQDAAAASEVTQESGEEAPGVEMVEPGLQDAVATESGGRGAQEGEAVNAGGHGAQEGEAVNAGGRGAQEGEAANAGGRGAQEGGAAKAAESGTVTAKITESEGGRRPARSIAEASAADLTDGQLEALRYSDNPGRFLRNRGALPTYSSDELGKTRKIVNTKEELIEAARREILATETIRIPVEEIAQNRAKRNAGESGYKTQPDAGSRGPAESENPQAEDVPVNTGDRLSADGSDSAGNNSPFTGRTPEKTERRVEEERPEGAGVKAGRGEAEGYAEAGYGEAEGYAEDGYGEAEEYAEDGYGEAEEYAEDGYGEAEEYAEDDSYGETEEYPEDREYAADAAVAEDGEYPENDDYEDEDEDDALMIPEHLRSLFGGFTEIDGLEEQIANAILQAESRGADRTSRTGNLLIFGAHGSGKTTLATGIAKAVAQDKGSEVLKLARIYAADLNRKDIAATIAKISGGFLIVEEAGDLEDEIVEQLTTAMEFRTDGLVVILEDEQSYVHELLMKHPRFTMKFTAQIYLPVYTAEELGMFGQRYARSQDYVISEEGLEVIRNRVSDVAAEGKEMSVGDVVAMIQKAIQHSNRFLRKLTLGKKRYDKDDFVILFAKDFK